MSDQKHVDLGIDFGNIRSYAEYKRVWRSLCPIQTTMVEKNEEWGFGGRPSDYKLIFRFRFDTGEECHEKHE